jgi:predicted Zn-dependent protease
MNPLPWPDNHYLDAAEGWLSLGNPAEATAEIDRMAPEMRLHPEVLNVRWQILAREKNWKTCMVIAGTLTRLIPESSVGWIHLSYTLHELGRTQEAWDNLQAIAERFPDDCTISYNQACYACRLGNLSTAEALLLHIMKIGDRDEMKRVALSDSDLQPLWKTITKM